jgi:sec-independent protein translocase protein TatC
VVWKRLPRRLRHGEEATLVEHLGELRARLLIALASIALAFAVAFAFHEQLIEWLREPLPPGKELVTLGVTEPFFTAVKVSFYAAFALALPVVLYQLWSFLAPAMEENTQRIVSVFVLFATALFAGGLAFGYFVVLPKAVAFLTEFDDQLYDVQIRASYYYSFVSLALVGMAVVFELPIFILALVRLRVLSADRLRRNRRMGIFLVVLVAILLPTVDPVSLAFEVIPLLLLFEASIWLAVFMERRWERAAEEEWLASELEADQP